ncbi:MAG: CarD family transcriptional regulator [Clostridia bacterium]|nr:CarD family transcriptional regulator [Clostridia bacterium]
MAEVFDVGSAVVYDVYGVCRVQEIKMMSFSRDKIKEKYYVLAPLNSAISTYYVPVNGEKLNKKLRRPFTVEQIHSLLDKVKDCDYGWIDNRQLRADSYHQILHEGVTSELLALIRCLFERKQELSEKGKNLSSTDEGVLSSAEKLINEEFAFSLGIESGEVSSYIKEYFEKKN